MFLRRKYRRKRTRPIAGLVLLGTLVVIGHWYTEPGALNLPQAKPIGEVTARVVAVIDGDTLILDQVEERIRIWGLDAPEMDTSAGQVAKDALSSMVAGQLVSCLGRDVDRYGRVVAQCRDAAGDDIAQLMISAGVASEYCSFSRGHYGTC